MSDTRWWRLKDWVINLLRQEPMGADELASLLNKPVDILYVGMILEDMISKGEIDYSKWVFTLSIKTQEETKP